MLLMAAPLAGRPARRIPAWYVPSSRRCTDYRWQLEPEDSPPQPLQPGDHGEPDETERT